ncbi:car, partial [Symbiodinium microadriaticum]
MAEVAADVATVRAVLPEFEYSAALDEAAHSAELRARQQEISTAKAELQQQLQAEKAKVVAAEEEISLAKDADKARADKLNEKVTTLIDRQVELQTAEKEYQEVEASGRCEAQTGEDLREAMQKHEHITKTVISSLLAGTCTSGKVKSEYLEALRGYLQEIQVEKTLVAAADGLGVAPDKRGTFDKMAIDSITEALAEKHRSLE